MKDRHEIFTVTRKLHKRILLKEIEDDIDKYTVKVITPDRKNKKKRNESVVFYRKLDDWKFEDYE
jgi:hypothetical protein